MKKILAVFLFFMLLINVCACGSNNQNNDTDSNDEPTISIMEKGALEYIAQLPDDQNNISVKALFEKIDAGEQMFVIDLRIQKLYEDLAVGLGHIKGAVDLPFGTAVADKLKYIPNDRLVIVYCDSNKNASQAVAVLNSLESMPNA